MRVTIPRLWKPPNKIFSLINYPCFLQCVSRGELQEAEGTVSGLLAVAASSEFGTANGKQRMSALTSFGMGEKGVSLKCFSILAFKSR